MKITEELLEGFLNRFCCITVPHRFEPFPKKWWTYGDVVSIDVENKSIVVRNLDGGLHEIFWKEIFEIYLAPKKISIEKAENNKSIASSADKFNEYYGGK